MMVRTDYAKILRAVVLYLGNGLDVMHFKDGDRRGRIVPSICRTLSGVAARHLALRSH